MIPNIFISSTIQDLSYLRDSIRDLILEIGYNPIMSEYGEIGFLPSASAEDSCYLTIRECNLAIIIVGKRYGSLSKNGFSVTHNEFKTARENKIPVIFLVSEEVLSFKRVFEVNSKTDDLNFPGMEDPSKLFQFVREFSESEINNGLLQFSTAQSAKIVLKKQLAHIFGDLLNKHFDPIKSEIKDILSEITTLRHILLKKDQDVARQFASALRFLLNEENKLLKEVSETISGSMEEAVQNLLDSLTFLNYLESKQIQFKNLDNDFFKKAYNEKILDNFFEQGIKAIVHAKLPYETTGSKATLGVVPEYNIQSDDPKESRVFFAYGKNDFWGNNNSIKLFEAIFEKLISISNVKH